MNIKPWSTKDQKLRQTPLNFQKYYTTPTRPTESVYAMTGFSGRITGIRIRSRVQALLLLDMYNLLTDVAEKEQRILAAWNATCLTMKMLNDQKTILKEKHKDEMNRKRRREG